MSEQQRKRSYKEFVELFKKWLDKDLDRWKLIATMKFFLEYRYNQNDDIEDVAMQTLKQMEEAGIDKEQGFQIWNYRAFEEMLYAAATENNIDIAKIKNCKTVQARLQVLRQKEEEETQEIEYKNHSLKRVMISP